MSNEELTKIKLESVPVKYSQEQRDCSRISNQLLRNLASSRINIKEFENEVAYWYVSDYLDRCHYHPLPTKTREVLEFEKKHRNWKGEAERRGRVFDEELFFENQMRKEVQRYYEERERIKNINTGNLLWLKELKKIIPEKDISSHEKLDCKIHELALGIEEEELKDENY